MWDLNSDGDGGEDAYIRPETEARVPAVTIRHSGKGAPIRKKRDHGVQRGKDLNIKARQNAANNERGETRPYEGRNRKVQNAWS